MSENNRVHAINAIAERVPLAPTEELPPDASLSTYGEDVFGAKMIRKKLTTKSRSVRPAAEDRKKGRKRGR